MSPHFNNIISKLFQGEARKCMTITASPSMIRLNAKDVKPMTNDRAKVEVNLARI